MAKERMGGQGAASRGVSYRGLFKNFLCSAPDVLTLMYMLPSGREVLMPLRG